MILLTNTQPPVVKHEYRLQTEAKVQENTEPSENKMAVAAVGIGIGITALIGIPLAIYIMVRLSKKNKK